MRLRFTKGNLEKFISSDELYFEFRCKGKEFSFNVYHNAYRVFHGKKLVTTVIKDIDIDVLYDIVWSDVSNY